MWLTTSWSVSMETVSACQAAWIAFGSATPGMASWAGPAPFSRVALTSHVMTNCSPGARGRLQLAVMAGAPASSDWLSAGFGSKTTWVRTVVLSRPV